MSEPETRRPKILARTRANCHEKQRQPPLTTRREIALPNLRMSMPTPVLPVWIGSAAMAPNSRSSCQIPALEGQCRRKLPGRLGSIKRHEVIVALQPRGELVAIMRTAAMARLALPDDHPQSGRRFAQVADHAEAAPHGRLEIGPAPRVANGRRITPHARSVLVQ